jgi:predicted NACHT family NTPase
LEVDKKYSSQNRCFLIKKWRCTEGNIMLLEELLILWGVKNAVGFIFKEVFVKLAQDAIQDGLKDYLKDFFKSLLKDGIDLAKLKALTVAYGKANKLFVELWQAELEDTGIGKSEIQQNYSNAIDKFIRAQPVRTSLGYPLQKALGITLLDDIPALDAELNKIWNELNLCNLPTEFKWQNVAKKYNRRVKALATDSDELRLILNSETQEDIKEIIQQNTPIAPDFKFSRYQQGLKDAFSNLKLDYLDTSGYKYTLQLWNIFLPTNIQEQNVSQPNVGSIFDILNAQKIYKHTVILGHPGSGKSTLVQYKALEWARTGGNNLSVQELPLLIELRNYVENREKNVCKNFLDYFHEATGVVGGNLNQHELDKWLRNNQTIVMFDGLDEVLDTRERENVIIDIINFTETYQRARVIVTSRVTGYEPQGSKFRHAHFREFMLQDFDQEQIRAFINRWHELAFEEENERKKKCQRLQNSISFPAFQELAGNPLLLTMMAILNRYEELPRDRSTLYEHASEVLLHRWDYERNLPAYSKLDSEVNRYIDYQDKREMLRLVAYRMQASTSTLANNISKEDLEDTLARYLQDKFPDKAKIVARGLREILTTRSFILCFFGGNSYGFVHRTFLEYFCAVYFVEQYKKEQTISLEFLKQNIFRERCYDPSWHEVLTLIVAQLYFTFAGEIIDYLIDLDQDTKHFKNLFLAHQCILNVRDYRNLQPIADKLSQKLKQLAENQNGVTDDIRQQAEEAINSLRALA